MSNISAETAEHEVEKGGEIFRVGQLIVSGYLLYYAGGEEFRSRVALARWIVGLAAPLGFFAYRLKRRSTLSAAAIPPRTTAVSCRQLASSSPVAGVRDLIRRALILRSSGAEIARAEDD